MKHLCTSHTWIINNHHLTFSVTKYSFSVTKYTHSLHGLQLQYISPFCRSLVQKENENTKI